MLRFRTCCLVCSLTVGSYIIASLQIIGNVYLAVRDIKVMSIYHDTGLSSTQLERFEMPQTSLYYFSTFMYVITIFVSICLIAGTQKRIRHLLMPYLAVTGISSIIVGILTIVFLVRSLKATNYLEITITFAIYFGKQIVYKINFLFNYDF